MTDLTITPTTINQARKVLLAQAERGHAVPVELWESLTIVQEEMYATQQLALVTVAQKGFEDYEARHAAERKVAELNAELEDQPRRGWFRR